MVQVVLVAPEIPANTGNIARTCAATGTPLHLIDPLGFQLTDRQMKRAGLDYWESVDLHRHRSWGAFLEQSATDHATARLWCFETCGQQLYTEVIYQPADWLIFGSETQGLPAEITHHFPCVRIPLHDTVRSLNLANSVAIGLFETVRQLGLMPAKPAS